MTGATAGRTVDEPGRPALDRGGGSGLDLRRQIPTGHRRPDVSAGGGARPARSRPVRIGQEHAGSRPRRAWCRTSCPAPGRAASGSAGWRSPRRRPGCWASGSASSSRTPTASWSCRESTTRSRSAWRTAAGRGRRWSRAFPRRWRRWAWRASSRAAQSLSPAARSSAWRSRTCSRPARVLLVLDEPTANLDPPGMYSVFERLAVLARRREHTIVLIEHRLEAALPLADDVLLIDDEGHQLAFAPAGSVGREAVELLERSGAWVPRAWQGARPADTRAGQPASSGRSSRRPSRRPPPAGRPRPARFCWRPSTFASNTLPTRAGSEWPWTGCRFPCGPASESRSSGRTAPGSRACCSRWRGCFGRRPGPCDCARCLGTVKRPSPCATLRG